MSNGFAPDLTGAKAGDWLLICEACGYQHPTNAGASPICPDCRTRMTVFYVKPGDVPPSNVEKT